MSQWTFADDPTPEAPAKPSEPAPVAPAPPDETAPEVSSAPPDTVAPSVAVVAPAATKPASATPNATTLSATAPSATATPPVTARPNAPTASNPAAPSVPRNAPAPNAPAPNAPAPKTNAPPRAPRPAPPPATPESALSPDAQATLRAAQNALANAQRAQSAPPSGGVPRPPAPAMPAPAAPTVATPAAPNARAPQAATPPASTPQTPASTPQMPAPQAPAQAAPQTLRPVPAPQAPSPQAPSPQAPSSQAQASVAAPPAPRSAPAPQNAPVVPSPSANVPHSGRGAAPNVPSPSVPAPTPPLSAEPRPGAPKPNANVATGPSIPAPQMPTPHVSSTPMTPQVSTASTNARDVIRQTESEGLDVSGRALLEKLYPASAWLFRISIAVGGLALLFLLLGLLSARNLAPASGTEITSEAYAQLEKAAPNLRLAAIVFCWSLFGAALSSVVLAFDLKSSGLVTALLGVALRFGFPFLILAACGKTPVTGNVVNAFVQSIPLTLVVLIGMLKWAGDVAIWLIALPERVRSRADVGVARPAEAKQQAIAASANMFSPCWNLPFCREVIRKQCPAFLAKKRCWKFGRGCYCDEEMISRIIRGEALDIVQSPTRQSRQGKPPCGRCHIYLEHQRHKFRAISPLAMPITGAVVFFGWPFYALAFNAIGSALAPLFAGLTFDTRSITPDAIKPADPSTAQYGQVDPTQVSNVAQYVVGGILGFLVLIYISKFIEWAIYKAKL